MGLPYPIEEIEKIKAEAAKPATAAPKAPGAADVGTSVKYAREDHVHEIQTSVSGNAGTATRLAAARTISLTGDVTGSKDFDGSANAAITATLVNSGVTAGAYGPDADVTPAFSTTFKVPYIKVDSKGRVTQAATHTVKLPAAPVNITGNAATATKLATARTISLTGDVTGSKDFDGSANATITATLVNSGVGAGSYGPSSNATPGYGATFQVPYFTVDSKGRVTAASTKTVKIPAGPVNITGNAATASKISSTVLTFSNGTQIWVA